ncbi:MAG: transposase [Bacteroidota bacterium]
MADKPLIELILPQGLLEYFEVTDCVKSEECYRFYLSEKNIIPKEYQKDKLTSKGFYDEITIQDFPIRGKAVYLQIKRRKWLNETSGQIVCRDWNLVAKGTRMTEEFATFLKGIIRF